MELKDFIEIAKRNTPWWNTTRGLLVFSGLIVLAYFFLPLAFPIPLRARSIVFGLVLVAYLTPWLASRYWPKGSRWVLMFALDTDPEADAYLQKAMRGMRYRLGNIPTQHKVVIKRIHHSEVTARKQADELVNGKKADLVIWGDFADAMVNGEPVSVLEHISYTHRLTPVMQRNLNLYRRDIVLAMGGREWLVRHKQSLSDIIRLQDNFADISLFVIAVQMFSDESSVDDSVLVFEHLLSSAERLDRQALADRLKGFLIQSVLLQATFASHAGRWQQAKTYAERLAQMGVSGASIDTILARASYELGDEPSARKYTEMLQERDPGNSIVLFNTAFFAIMDKEYDVARDTYDRLHKYKKLDNDPREIAKFFSHRIEADSCEIAFLYARGVVNLWYCDRESGIVDLRLFLSKAGDSGVYLPMATRAKELLANAERVKRHTADARAEAARRQQRQKRRQGRR